MQAHPSHTSLVCATQDDGFTFVEIVIAIAILAVVITSMVALMTMNTTVALRAENKSRVTDELAQMADKLRSMPYEDAGKQTSYTSDDGLVVMRLTTKMTTLNGANAKVITIFGYSTKMDPNNKQTIQVILRSPGTGVPDTPSEPEDPTSTPPPVISKFEIRPQGYSTPVWRGATISGTPQIVVSASAGSASSVIVAIRIYAESRLIEEFPYPSNNQIYNTSWESALEDPLTHLPEYVDGITPVTVEVIDDRGGKTSQEISIVLDNQPVTNTFSDQTLSVTKYTNGGGIGIGWNAIPDPTNDGKPALRYQVSLTAVDKWGTPRYSSVLTMTSSVLGQLPPTFVVFNTAYNKQYIYEARVRVLCPGGCSHTGAEQMSSIYLSETFTK